MGKEEETCSMPSVGPVMQSNRGALVAAVAVTFNVLLCSAFVVHLPSPRVGYGHSGGFGGSGTFRGLDAEGPAAKRGALKVRRHHKARGATPRLVSMRVVTAQGQSKPDWRPWTTKPRAVSRGADASTVAGAAIHPRDCDKAGTTATTMPVMAAGVGGVATAEADGAAMSALEESQWDWERLRKGGNSDLFEEMEWDKARSSAAQAVTKLIELEVGRDGIDEDGGKEPAAEASGQPVEETPVEAVAAEAEAAAALAGDSLDVPAATAPTTAAAATAAAPERRAPQLLRNLRAAVASLRPLRFRPDKAVAGDNLKGAGTTGSPPIPPAFLRPPHEARDGGFNAAHALGWLNPRPTPQPATPPSDGAYSYNGWDGGGGSWFGDAAAAASAAGLASAATSAAATAATAAHDQWEPAAVTAAVTAGAAAAAAAAATHWQNSQWGQQQLLQVQGDSGHSDNNNNGAGELSAAAALQWGPPPPPLHPNHDHSASAHHLVPPALTGAELCQRLAQAGLSPRTGWDIFWSSDSSLTQALGAGPGGSVTGEAMAAMAMPGGGGGGGGWAGPTGSSGLAAAAAAPQWQQPRTPPPQEGNSWTTMPGGSGDSGAGQEQGELLQWSEFGNSEGWGGGGAAW